MPTKTVKEYTHKGFPVGISFAMGNEWGDYKNKFYVNNSLPFGVRAHKDLKTLEANIEAGFNKWLATRPKDPEGWAELVSSCVIQTGYEDWHVDEQRLMSVLDRYAELKNKLCRKSLTPKGFGAE